MITTVGLKLAGVGMICCHILNAQRAFGNDTHPQGYVTLNNFPVTDPKLEQMIYAVSAELDIPCVHLFNGRRKSTGMAKFDETGKNVHSVSSILQDRY